jgi:hypothetical protein
MHGEANVPVYKKKDQKELRNRRPAQKIRASRESNGGPVLEKALLWSISAKCSNRAAGSYMRRQHS